MLKKIIDTPTPIQKNLTRNYSTFFARRLIPRDAPLKKRLAIDDHDDEIQSSSHTKPVKIQNGHTTTTPKKEDDKDLVKPVHYTLKK